MARLVNCLFTSLVLLGSIAATAVPATTPHIERIGEGRHAYSMHSREAGERQVFSLHSRTPPDGLDPQSVRSRSTGNEITAFSTRNAFTSTVNVPREDTCPAPVNLVGKAPKKNIWGGLTNQEAKSIFAYVYGSSAGLNLTTYEKKGLWDNYVYLIEQIMPNKTDAVAYIDGNGPLPDRYARVAISFGAMEDPYYEDYIVRSHASSLVHR